MLHFKGICILGDPGADSGDEGKSKRAEKCGTKKSKERREEPLGTMSYQTSSKRSPPFWLLIRHPQRSPGWEIWLDRHLEKWRGPENEWGVRHLGKYPEVIWASSPRPRKAEGKVRSIVLLLLSKNVVFYAHQCPVFKVLITWGIFPSALRRNTRTRAHLDQNLFPTYLSSTDAALPQVFDTLCVYRFASILQMSN